MERDIVKIDDDISYIKRMIKQILYNDKDIIEILHNTELDPECPEDYVNVNIFPYLKVPNVQDTVKNYICFSVDDNEENRNNDIMKEQYISVVVFCHFSDIQTPYGVERHDLLSYLIRDLLNWTNKFGLQFKCVYNSEDSMDGKYACRTLKFIATKPNSLQRGVSTNRYEFIRN